ncbi:MAG: TolC family protein [Candidatus Omnitrophica bacterium]|nr:TolC family protein [Candidatus Omnitrophota bacterium]
MRWFKSHIQRFLIGLLPAWLAVVYPAFCEAQSTVLESVQVRPAQEGSLIEIRSNRSFSFVTYTLSDPERLIIDPVESGVECPLSGSSDFSGGIIRGWRWFGFGETHPAGEVDYLSFELHDAAEHLIESTDGKLLIRIRPVQRAAEPSSPAALYALPVSSAASSNLWDLGGALEYGLARHRPVVVAREEVELAQMKVREARRALYPAATLKTSWTTGTASKVDFREYSSGIQLEHPIYYSGRLLETYRQSLVNLQVSEKRQGKVKADYSLEVEQSYYQWVGAKAILQAQEGLLARAEDFLERSRARFDKGLLTRLEVLNVEAQANQAKFQRVTAENDGFLARIKFLQKVNLGPEALVEVTGELPPPSSKRVDLEEALQLAAQYRPDILVNSLLVEFHEFEERIAKAKGKLKVELSGFIGASAAAFETEPLDSGEDYFIGFKATQNWGPHGVTASLTDTHTSPRLGQTTRTDSTVYSGEVGILNQLAGLSEVQQARINLEKAQNDLEEAKTNAFQEVQEAYISYQKALLQMEYAQQKIGFREEQVKILEAQASLNEATPSQVMESVMKLTEERVGAVQALTNTHVALAKLNKAIGLTEHYR